MTLFWEMPNFIAAKICWFTVYICSLYWSQFSCLYTTKYQLGGHKQHALRSLILLHGSSNQTLATLIFSLISNSLCHVCAHIPNIATEWFKVLVTQQSLAQLLTMLFQFCSHPPYQDWGHVCIMSLQCWPDWVLVGVWGFWINLVSVYC